MQQKGYVSGDLFPHWYLECTLPRFNRCEGPKGGKGFKLGVSIDRAFDT